MAIKNGRPGVMIAPGLRPPNPDEERDAPQPTETASASSSGTGPETSATTR